MSPAALLAYKETDQIGVLLNRLEQRKGRTSRHSGNLHGNGIVAPEESFVDQALAHLGTRYKYGGESPSGFDCSGLVWYVAQQSLGIKLPRTSAEQAKQGVQVSRSELQRGDLVFFNTMGRRYSHVGIYLGGGEFVHAPSTGGKVRIEKLSANYWKSRYNGARRLDVDGLTRVAAR